MIISGIIEQDAKEIEDNFSVAPLILSRVITEKEWVCYVLKKKASSASSRRNNFLSLTNNCIMYFFRRGKPTIDHPQNL